MGFCGGCYTREKSIGNVILVRQGESNYVTRGVGVIPRLFLPGPKSVALIYIFRGGYSFTPLPL